MRGVAYNNNYGGSPLYVAVGRGGTVMRSTDSVTWTPLALPPVFTDLQGVCWDGTNHQFVAVGNAGVILTSPDGIAWTGWTGPYVRALNAVAYANGYLMAVGNGGYAIWSTDGHTWNDVSTGTANLNGVFGVLYASTTYFQVAGDATGGNAVVLYTTVGSWTWNPLTPSPATGTYNLNAMLYTGGINTNSDWLMVGDNALIYRQYPSPTITQQTVSGSRNFYGIAINGTAANSLRVVVGANGRIVTSTNETAWTNRVSTVAASLYAVIWDGSQFVAVGNEGVVITSPDGITWTRRTAGDTRVLNSVAYSPTANGGSPRFVAVDRQSIQTSDDGGMTWAVQTYPDPQSLLGGVVWANNHFVAVGAAGVILASADGVTWTHYDYTTGPPDLKDVAFGNGVYVAVGGGTSPSPYTTILTSPDGQTWTPAGLPADLVTNPRVLNGVAYVSSGNFFLAVGDAKDAATGTVLWDAGDPTGTWLDLSSRYSISPPGGGPFPAVYNLNAVVEGGPDASNGGAQDYLLVGDHGTLAYSWVGDNYLYPADSGVTNPLNGAQWDGCNYLAVGSVGTILVSQDIQSWARMPEPNRNILYGVAAGPSDYVAVGEGGTALHAARVAANVDPSNPPAAGYPSASYDFDCAPTGGAGSYSYLWDFGDGTTDTNQDTSHAYTTSDTFNWTLTAWDCSGLVGCASGTIVISCPAITLSPSTLPSALIGVPYSEQITASGGSGSYTFAVTAGLPPAGLNLASDGVLSGVPTVTGSAPFTVTATLDGTSCIGSQSYTLGVCPVITVIPSTLPNPSLGIAFVKSFSASGGTGPYIFSYSGTLPTGLSLSPGGMLSGTPTSAGSYSFSVIATDINGCSGGVAFNLTVGAYDAHLWDDQGRSVLCLSTKLKTWSYTILKGTGAGSTYTGVGMISNANGGYVFNASGAMILQAQVFTRDHWGTAVFRYPTKGINSSLYDANTLDDPPECGVKQ